MTGMERDEEEWREGRGDMRGGGREWKRTTFREMGGGDEVGKHKWEG